MMKHIISFSWPEMLLFTSLLMLSACSGNLSQIVLLEDEFDQLPSGYILSDNGPSTEYHYLPGSGKAGPWNVAVFGRQKGYSTAWELVGSPDGNYLRQNYFAVDSELEQVSRFTHPLIIAGDSIWHDYKVQFVFSPKETLDKCGLVFRYQNSRSYYFYGMEGNRLVVKMVDQATAPHRPYEVVLISAPYQWEAGKVYKGVVSIRGNQIYTLLNDSLSLVAEDNTYLRGKVGFLSDVPADFYKMEVGTLNRERRKMSRYKGTLANASSMRISENANAVLWKKVSVEGFGVGGNLRFGDLNNDGNLDVVLGQVVHHGPGEANPELSCLTAMTFDGDILWRRGTPDPKNYKLTDEVAFQIHDLDSDGTKEVIYTMDFWLNIVDGKTGRLLRRVQTPLSRDPASKYSRILGEGIYFCDLSGKGRDSDILIKDQSSNIWAYNENLRLLWTQHFKSGRYPYAYDVDGDGKDEVALGYSLIDDDGSFIWNREAEIGDNANAVIISNMGIPGDSSLKIIYGAADWGSIILDIDGNILSHHAIGHVQNFAMAEFRPDKPGLEMVSANFWGNQGIINLYDAEGNVYHTFEPGPYSSRCFPVNWRGDGIEYFLLNTNPGDGGLYDGYGQRTVVFPDDGHPDMCNAVLDLTGDARDEIVSWDQNEIWVYTQDDSPRQGRIFSPVRSPLYNYSNYQFALSMPAWTE